MRGRTLTLVAAGSAAVIAVAVAVSGTAFAGPSTGTRAAAGVLWSADTSIGTKTFEGVEEAPGTVTVADDPQGKYGPSYRYETWQNPNGVKARCESRGMRQPDGSVLLLNSSQVGKTFYLGWRALWNPMPTQRGAWVALFQLHVDGISSGQAGAGPFILRTLGDGKLHFQLEGPTGASHDIWVGNLSLNTWNSFVIGFKLSRTGTGAGAGSVSFWYDGVQQRLTNGAMTEAATTLWGDHVNVKWGVYRSGANKTGHAVAFMNGAKLGTTYASVAP